MLNRYTDCFGIITQTVPAKWLLAHPDAVGSAWTSRRMNTLIGGIDALVAIPTCPASKKQNTGRSFKSSTAP